MKKVVLCVLDGFGYSKKINGNAIYNANTPNINKLLKIYPSKYLNASGTYVGLLENTPGNSEVGHLSLGAGRVIKQPLTIVNESITDKSIFKNSNILNAILYAYLRLCKIIS